MKHISSILLIIIVAVVALLFLRPEPTPATLVKASPVVDQKMPSQSSRDSAKISSESPRGSQSAVVLSANQSRFITDRDLDVLALNPSELAALNQACEHALTTVLFEMANAGRIDTLGGASAQFSVHLGSHAAERLRNHLYGQIKAIIGTTRFEKFLSLGTLTQFEAKFDFFGEFPTRYVFAGTGESWSTSPLIEMRAEIDRTEAGIHKFTSLTEGKLPRREFANRYGDVAKRVMGSD